MLYYPCSLDSAAGGADLPGPLEGLLKKVIKRIGPKGRFTEEEIASVWTAAVGRKAAKHTRPVLLRKSVLTVNVDGSGWLYELTTRKKETLKKLVRRGAVGKKIKDIRFRIGELA